RFAQLRATLRKWFTHPHSHVSLKTHATADCILIDVQDECSDLPTGESQRYFSPLRSVPPA
ncbi:MAG: hypothetical protein ACXWCS_12415, partial [Burkholderiales bacterium]